MKVESYLVMPKSFIDEKFGSYEPKHFIEHPEICYAPIHNYDTVQHLIEIEKIDPVYQSICIRIELNSKFLLGYDINGLNLWEDILYALKRILDKGESEGTLGTDYYSLKMRSLNDSQVEWKVFEEEKVYYSEIVGKKELFEGLVKGGIEYYSTLLTHKYPEDTEDLEDHLNMFKELEKTLVNLKL